LVATWYERLTWSHGDAYDLRPVELGGWNLGALICGENTNTLARFTLLSQGERLHIATYPPAWPFDGRTETYDYDLAYNIQLRSAAHAFEGKVFVIVASTTLDEEALHQVAQHDDQIENALTATAPVSMIVGPDGRLVAGPLAEPEGILYGEVNLQREVVAKQAHDIVGTYNRADIFTLSVDMRRHTILQPHEGEDAPGGNQDDSPGRD
jgi:nitrilase/aliphatic nitrilase